MQDCCFLLFWFFTWSRIVCGVSSIPLKLGCFLKSMELDSCSKSYWGRERIIGLLFYRVQIFTWNVFAACKVKNCWNRVSAYSSLLCSLFCPIKWSNPPRWVYLDMPNAAPCTLPHLLLLSLWHNLHTLSLECDVKTERGWKLCSTLPKKLWKFIVWNFLSSLLCSKIELCVVFPPKKVMNTNCNSVQKVS